MQLCSGPLAGGIRNMHTDSMTKKTIITLAIILISTMIGCSKDNGSVNSSNAKYPDVLVPLTVGHQWVYLTQALDSAGNVWGEKYDTVVVTKDTTFESERWYFLHPYQGWVTNRQSGYWYRNDSWVTLLYPYPAKSGDSLIMSNGAIIYTQSTSDTVYSSAGRFICYRYSSTNHVYKYSPSIGLVYFSQKGSSQYVIERKILVSYTFK
jgi:hypothetical protein